MLLDFVEIGQLQSLDAEHVIPFLQKRLKWRVLSVSGEPVDTRALAAEKKFKINVSCKVERGGRDSGNVEYSNFPEVVEGIIGNASSDAGSLEAYATV